MSSFQEMIYKYIVLPSAEFKIREARKSLENVMTLLEELKFLSTQPTNGDDN